MVPVKLSPAPARGGLSSKSSGGGGGGSSGGSGSSGSSSLVLWLSSVTGILGWIIRITLLLLKNTRSRGEYQRQAGSGRPSQPTSWPVNACGCQGSTFLIFSFPRCFRSGSRVRWLQDTSHQKGSARRASGDPGCRMGACRRAAVEAEGRGGERMGFCSKKPAGSFGVPGLLVFSSPFPRGLRLQGTTWTGRISKVGSDWKALSSLAALRVRNWRSAEGRWGLPAQKGRVRGRRCPRKQAAEACDFANPGLGRCRSPTPSSTTRLPDLAAGCGAAVRPGPGSPGTSRLEVWRVSQGPIFSFRILREGVENQDGNWIGCRVAQNWNLPESGGAGRDCSVVQFLWDISSALSSLPLPLGRVSNINKPKARSLSQVCRDGTKGRASLSLLLRPVVVLFACFKY